MSAETVTLQQWLGGFEQELVFQKADNASEPGDWWAAEFDVLPDAAVINFVIKYYEHFDNNDGQDYKALVQLDESGGYCRHILSSDPSVGCCGQLLKWRTLLCQARPMRTSCGRLESLL
jgi:hypothetical protein